jgi:hypothetical protein
VTAAARRIRPCQIAAGHVFPVVSNTRSCHSFSFSQCSGGLHVPGPAQPGAPRSSPVAPSPPNRCPGPTVPLPPPDTSPHTPVPVSFAAAAAAASRAPRPPPAAGTRACSLGISLPTAARRPTELRRPDDPSRRARPGRPPAAHRTAAGCRRSIAEQRQVPSCRRRRLQASRPVARPGFPRPTTRRAPWRREPGAARGPVDPVGPRSQSLGNKGARSEAAGRGRRRRSRSPRRVVGDSGAAEAAGEPDRWVREEGAR